MDKLSLEYINLRTGGITAEPVNDGVYLKSIVKQKDDVVALFPTTACITMYDGMEFFSEMKLNIFKKAHPDFLRQRENLRKLLKATGAAEVYTTRLIYGTDEVAIVDEQGIYLSDGRTVMAENYDPFNADMQFAADAIITDRRNVALVMYCADCPTAFIRDKKTGAIGVLHSMWKGLVIDPDNSGCFTSIVEATVDKMTETYGTDPRDLEVTIFPCIGLDQFEVGPEVAAKFRKSGLENHVYCRGTDTKTYIDLVGAMAELFRDSGVRKESIECTAYTTADYGFNSLRMAPTNYVNESLVAAPIDAVSEAVVPMPTAPVLHSAEDVEHTKVKSSALNVLIAIRK